MVDSPGTTPLKDLQFGLDKEAYQSGLGEIWERIKVYGKARVPTGGTTTISSGSSSGFYLAAFGSYAREFQSRVSSRRVPETVLREGVEKGTRPHEVDYPSPARASHSEVLEQYFEANLAIAGVRFVDNAGLVPSLAERIQSMPKDKERAVAMFDYNVHAQKAYMDEIAKIRKPDPRDQAAVLRAKAQKNAIALKHLENLIDDSHGPEFLTQEFVNQFGNVEQRRIPNPGAMQLGYNVGNGNEVTFREPGNINAIKSYYDGSFALMVNYFEAIKRNSPGADLVERRDGFLGKTEDRSAAFKLPDRLDYTPGRHFSPASIVTPKEVEKANKATVSARLQDRINALAQKPSIVGAIGTRTIMNALKKLQLDLNDNDTLGDTGSVKYYDNPVEGMKLADMRHSILGGSGDNHAAFMNGPTGQAASSVENVMDAQLRTTKITPELLHDIEVTADALYVMATVTSATPPGPLPNRPASAGVASRSAPKPGRK